MTKHADTPRKAATFRIEQELLDGLRTVAERDGIPVSEQVRRAIEMWLTSKGVKAERKRAATRRRP